MKKEYSKFVKVILSCISRVFDYLTQTFTQVNERVILFIGKPDYSDNPRALCDYMVDAGYLDRYDIYYAVSDINTPDLYSTNSQIRFIPLTNDYGYMPYKTRKILHSAKYTFASHGFYVPIEKFRKEQMHILLWHGCGYKGASAIDGKRTFDKALVPGPLFIETKCKFWNTTPEYIIAKGYPRYDWMLKPSINAINFYRDIKNNYSKVIIWMPTYRNSVANKRASENIITSFPLIDGMADFMELDRYCQEKNILILLKLHMSQRQYDISWDKLKNIRQITNHDFDVAKINLYEFLPLTDALISDYSSVAIDYLISNKPIAYTLDDFELYNKARGFVFDSPLDYMPGHHLYSLNELKSFIDDISQNKDQYKEQRAIIKKQAIVSSENYCKDILKELNI